LLFIIKTGILFPETDTWKQKAAVKAIDGASKLPVIREYPEKERGQEKG
jgi:hypothetical protein